MLLPTVQFCLWCLRFLNFSILHAYVWCPILSWVSPSFHLFCLRCLCMLSNSVFVIFGFSPFLFWMLSVHLCRLLPLFCWLLFYWRFSLCLYHTAMAYFLPYSVLSRWRLLSLICLRPLPISDGEEKLGAMHLTFNLLPSLSSCLSMFRTSVSACFFFRLFGLSI